MVTVVAWPVRTVPVRMPRGSMPGQPSVQNAGTVRERESNPYPACNTVRHPTPPNDMTRLPLVNADTPGVDAELVHAVKLRRGGELLVLDRLLLHSTPVARGWNAYLGAIRGACLLDGAIRELAILLVARLNRAPYEFNQHEPVALREGAAPEQIAALDAWADSPRFSARERAVLAYAQAMTLDVQVAAPVFDALRPWFNEREIVELTATIAAYNMVSRFLEALDVRPEVRGV